MYLLKENHKTQGNQGNFGETAGQTVQNFIWKTIEGNAKVYVTIFEILILHDLAVSQILPKLVILTKLTLVDIKLRKIKISNIIA